MSDHTNARAQPLWSETQLALADGVDEPGNAEARVSLTSYLEARVVAAWSLLGVAMLVTLVSVIGYNVPNAGLPRMTLVFAWVLLVALAVGLFTGRTLFVRDVVALFLVGYFVSTVATALIATPLVRLTGETIGVMIVVPIVEEALKALPVLLFALGPGRRVSGERTLVDYTLAGFALGAGFMLREDLLWERYFMRVEFPLSVIIPWGYHEPGTGVSPGHPGWTLLVCFGIGLMVIHRKRLWALVMAILAISVAVFEHMAWNSPASIDLLPLTAHGTVTTVAMFGAVLFAIVQGRAVTQWGGRRETRFRPIPLFRGESWQQLVRAPWRLSPWRRWSRILRYNLMLTRLQMEAWRAERAGAPSQIDPRALALLELAKLQAQARP